MRQTKGAVQISHADNAHRARQMTLEDEAHGYGGVGKPR
jgi:hypothetical protein